MDALGPIVWERRVDRPCEPWLLTRAEPRATVSGLVLSDWVVGGFASIPGPGLVKLHDEDGRTVVYRAVAQGDEVLLEWPD